MGEVVQFSGPSNLPVKTTGVVVHFGCKGQKKRFNQHLDGLSLAVRNDSGYLDLDYMLKQLLVEPGHDHHSLMDLFIAIQKECQRRYPEEDWRVRQ